MTPPQAFALALQHHQAGRLAEAEALYRQILAAEPAHAEALHHLGIIAHQAGRHDLALEWIRQSLTISPNNSAAYYHLGKAWRAVNRLEEAVTAYRRSLEINPAFPEGHNNLGNSLRELGRLGEAIATYHRAIQLKPDYAEAHHNLGIALAEQGQIDEASAAYRRALAIKPDFPAAHNHLGCALREQGRLEEAVAAFRGALQLKPDYAEAHNNLGITFAEQTRFDEAIAAYRLALQFKPDYAEARNNLGNALREIGRYEEAAVALRGALDLKPSYPEAHNNLGTVLAAQGQLDAAVAAYRRALELRPAYPGAQSNLGNVLKDQGQLDQAIAAYRRALELQPEYREACSNLVYALLFHPDQNAAVIAEEQQRWNRQFGEPLRRFIRPSTNDRDPERRLRIGYVSPNFHRHPICHFLIPLLEAHDQACIETYCYSSVRCPDEFTDRVKRAAGVWRDVRCLDDPALAGRIREDQIDILVDLTQHMADNRLLVFARKPAPIQVAWLGYPASTGLSAMDYRFTDGVMEPEGAPESDSVETPVRLPHCWFCFDAIESPAPSALPAQQSGQVTFGSLNNFSKVNETVLRLWADVLQAVEDSRLLLHCPAGSAQRWVHQRFEAWGIAPGRLDLVARTAHRSDYLELFQRIDIGLDPFPYTGGTTTCEALWMGVPVVSLAGRTAVSRLGLSVLTNAGFPEWAASSPANYVGIATQLARDLPRLAELRQTLRPHLQSSPLMDAPGFARHIESAYRTMWKRWCGEELTCQQ